MNEIKTTYADIPITYDEKRNLWRFELRGRERTAESLENAKKAIDTPVKENNPFVRFKAWRKESWEGFKQVEVTSIAESPSYSRDSYVWIVGANKQRSKERESAIFPTNEHNDPLVAKWMELDKQARAIGEQKGKIEDSMKHYKAPKES